MMNASICFECPMSKELNINYNGTDLQREFMDAVDGQTADVLVVLVVNDMDVESVHNEGAVGPSSTAEMDAVDDHKQNESASSIMDRISDSWIMLIVIAIVILVICVYTVRGKK